jgi:hypothetical protein
MRGTLDAPCARGSAIPPLRPMIRKGTAVPWVETASPSFTARHADVDAAGARQTLDDLEAFRERLDRRLPRTPGDLAVVIHSSIAQLSFAHPWLPLAQLAAAPASRRYFGGWFTAKEIHVLSPKVLRDRASAVPGSREALRLAPMHEYAHVALGQLNPGLPPPFTISSFNRYLRWAWLCEGAAAYLAGQVPHLGPAIARRLREGDRPTLPPAPRDALLLGGTVFVLLEGVAGGEAAVALASRLDPGGGAAAIERAFGLDLARVEREWHELLAGLAASGRR